jgi:hypothetical protein
MNENNENKVATTLADVLSLFDRSGLIGTRRRDMISAIKRFCEMVGTIPASVPAEPPHLRKLLSRIRPAAHGITAKSYSNSEAFWPPHFSLPASMTRSAGAPPIATQNGDHCCKS